MNATTIQELRAGVQGNQLSDDKMEQVRELLFGDYRRQSEARIATLEARIRELEGTQARKLEMIQARIEAIIGQLSDDRRTSFDSLARHFLELGERVQKLAKE